MIKLGLTGGIATGKTTVSNMLKAAGAIVLDADLIVHDLLKRSGAAYEPVVSHFGQDILDDEGEISRPKLGAVVFGNEEQRLKLNSLVHPLVREALQESVTYYEALESQNNTSYLLVMVIPLLYESNLSHLVDFSVVVYCPEPVQLERLMKRNQLSESEAKARMAAQIPIEEKVKKADEVIDNSRQETYTQEQMNLLLGGLTWDPYVEPS